jgi:5-methylcytosine-specific restriction protein A
MSIDRPVPRAVDFERVLDAEWDEARRRGQRTLDAVSRDVHRRVGGYPGPNHRMPLCCSVMRRKMRDGDEILYEPPSGQGASLRIRYRLTDD